MPVNISLAATKDKIKKSSTVVYLPFIEVDVVNPATLAVVDTLRVVNNTEDVVYQGNLFFAYQFSIDLKYESGGIPAVTLSVLDEKRIVIEKSKDYGGGIGFDVRLMVGNPALPDDSPEIIEYFKVVSSSTKGYSVSWGLGAENELSYAFPKRRQMRDRCSWRFRGKECGYDGPDKSCDLTLTGANGCESKFNSVRFGGFPGIRTG